MASNTEFIQHWNEVFQYKIKESDLYKPNEQFLTNALLHYLQKFNFDISLLINVRDNEIPENRRKFKIELCVYIDYLYKSGGNEASNSFLYYDLICPSPKKVVHLLKFLLNYLFFYNVMKEEIIEPTEEKLSQRSELQDKKSKLLIDKEKKQYRAKNLAKSVKKCRKTLPELDEKLKNLEIKECEQNDMIKSLENNLTTLNTQLRNTKMEEYNLKNAIVSELEIENLFSKKENIQKLLITKTELEQSIKSNDRERSCSILQLNILIKKLENALNIINLENITKSKELRQTHEKLLEKVKQQTLTNDKAIKLTEEEFKIIENLEISLNNKEDDMKKLEKLSSETIFNMANNYEKEQLLEVNLDSELNTLSDSLTEENEIRETILISANKLFTHLIDRDPTMLMSREGKPFY